MSGSKDHPLLQFRVNCPDTRFYYWHSSPDPRDLSEHGFNPQKRIGDLQKLRLQNRYLNHQILTLSSVSRNLTTTGYSHRCLRVIRSNWLESWTKFNKIDPRLMIFSLFPFAWSTQFPRGVIDRHYDKPRTVRWTVGARNDTGRGDLLMENVAKNLWYFSTS